MNDAPAVPDKPGNVTYHPDLIQGSDEWLDARLGLLTASEMKLVLTPTLKIANNDKLRAHVYELAAQRISRFVEPHYVGDEMLRGLEDEVEARILYEKHYAPVTECGFITNDRWGFTLGYSPDGLVGDDGLIEAKSRRQKYQVQTIVEAEVPADYVLQLQTGLLVSERQWIDFLSYSAGLPMVAIRVYPDEALQAAIVEAAMTFESRVDGILSGYDKALGSGARLIPTERKTDEEIVI